MICVELRATKLWYVADAEHISTMSPVNKTQDYDYYKGTDQIWSFRDDVDSHKAMKCVQLDAHTHMPQPRRKFTKDWIMIVQV